MKQLKAALDVGQIEITGVNSLGRLNNFTSRDYDLVAIDAGLEHLTRVLITLRSRAEYAGIPVLVECSRIATEIGFAGVLLRYRAMPCCQSDMVTRVKRRIAFESGEARRTSQGGSTRIGESGMNLYALLISTRFNVWRDVMAYNEKLAERIRMQLSDRTDVVERRMFGGLAFMVRGHMCCGVVGDELMARVGPGAYEAALKEKHAREMDFTGKPLRGMVYVAAPGIASAKQLGKWVERGLQFALTLPEKK